MAIIQQPDTLSLSGNLKSFVISSGNPVSFSLKEEDTVILDTSYEPGPDGRVTIDVREVVENRLSFILSHDNFYPQIAIAKTFTAVVDGQNVTFRALRAGVANLADTSANWLKLNFLTWQPAQKPVTYYSPEWLTYYAVEPGKLKLRAYFNDGAHQVVDIGNLVAGNAYTANLQYAVVAGILGNLYPSYYEVWAETSAGTRLTYIQRYLYSEPKSEQEQWFLFENSLGGIDTLRAYGDTDFTGNHEHKIAQSGDTLAEYAVDTKRFYNKNTGHLDEYERRWLLDFFPSKRKYVYASAAIRSIVVSESDVKYAASDLPSSYTFKYRFADTSPLLNLVRNQDSIPSDIVIPDISSPDFILPPRLSEYPRVALSEGVILPAFDPHSDTPKTTTVGALSSAIIEETLRQVPGAGEGGSLVQVLEEESILEPTNRNVFSAKRVIKEFTTRFQNLIASISDKYIRKDIPDTADEVITFAKGLSSADLAVFEKGLNSSFVLVEDGSTQGVAQGVTESDESGDSGEVVQSLTENLVGGSGATTLGELLNVDESFDTINDGVYSLKKQGGNFFPIVGGGGGAVSRMTLVHKTSSIATAPHNQDYNIGFAFTSTVSGESTGDGIVEYTVNGRLVDTGTVQQGDTYFNVKNYLSLGDNAISVKVTDSYGTNRTITFGITAVTVQLRSTFNSTQIYTDDVLFKFTPVGLGTMKVHILVDGVEETIVTTTQSNRQLTHTISSLAHGAHIITAYMTIDLGGTTITSNELRYSIIVARPGNNTVVISSSFNQPTTIQFDLVNIPYIVYNPASLTSNVELYVNETKISDVVVDRILQNWSYNFSQSGLHVLKIKCGAIEKTFDIFVETSDISNIEETEALQLKLVSEGRSNTEVNKDRWSYGSIESRFSNFNWKSDGWTIDENGGTFLKVTGDAQLTVPFKIFDTDFKQSGKTIEFAFKTENVTDLDYTVLSCMSGNKGFEITPQKAVFKSEQSTISTQFKENEYVRISISVQQAVRQRLITMFVNGILSGVVQYPVSDSFVQASPVDITISGKEAVVGLYAIRVYSTDLESYQVLNNHIFDFPSFAGKASLFSRNKILGSDSRISYNLLVEQLPCMIISGELPTYKGDKKTCSVSFEDRKNPERSFTATNVQNDVQGTSSQYYPRKNFKMKFRNGFEMTADGSHADGFQTHPHTLPTTVFTHKADFAEASGTHNTGMAKVVENLLRALNIKTPPQLIDARVRTTIDGFAIAIFHRPAEDGPMTFVGKYNFNTDKSAENTFGFSAPAECWEVCNNTSDRVLFKSSDYDSEDWLNDFEGRYPDGNENPVNLKRMTDWVVSCIGNSNKFKNELSQYFEKDFLISYYVITELFAMVDQRAKNCFWTTFDKNIWLPIFYDNDTCLGINNEGVNAFSFDVETGDKLGTQSVWNGDDSELWKLVVQAFPDEIKAMYQRIRKDDTLSYESALAILNGEHSDKWSETVYNEDGQFKYIDPLLEDGNGAYLYAAQGSRSEHRKWWLFNRFRYMDSRFDTGDFRDDFLTMRLYTPGGTLAVPPNADFVIEPFASQYIKAKWGSYTTHKRVKKGETIIFNAPNITFNDTETIIYGASYIRSLGDLSGKYAGTIDVSKATRLTELLIGNSTQGYSNTNLQTLHVGNNKMLRKIDVQNCPNLVQPLDLSGCDNIEEVHALGTGLTSVVLPDGGIVKKLELPASITNVKLVRQNALMSSNLFFESTNKISSLWVEDTSINSYAIAKSSPALQNIRLLGINATDTDLGFLISLLRKSGMDQNGYIIPNPVITGRLHVAIAHESWLVTVGEAYPDLEVTYDTAAQTPIRTITIRKEENNQLFAGARVKVNDSEYVANSNGVVNVETPNELEIIVMEEGRVPKVFIFPQSVVNTSHTIRSTPIVTLSVTVKDDFVGKPNVLVVYDGQNYYTNEQGIVNIRTWKGTRELKIVKGTFVYSRNITIAYVDLARTVVVPLEEYEVKPVISEENIQVTIFAVAGTSYQFSISEYNNATIDWGDDTRETPASNAIEHTYSTSGYYTIQVLDCALVTAFIGRNSTSVAATIAYWSVGNSKIKNLQFIDHTNLRFVGSIFKNDIGIRTSFSNVFNECRNLNVPLNLFEPFKPILRSFNKAFYRTMALKELPLDFLEGFADNVDWFQAFYISGIAGVVRIPSSFAFSSNCLNFLATTSYKGCSYIVEHVTPPTWASNQFVAVNYVIAIYVPDDSVDLYKNATGWSAYAAKILPMSEYIP